MESLFNQNKKVDQKFSIILKNVPYSIDLDLLSLVVESKTFCDESNQVTSVKEMKESSSKSSSRDVIIDYKHFDS